MTEPERRTDGAGDSTGETGIDEAMIERLVRAFYARVRNDDLIGPVFAAHIVDWEPHLAQICAFWSSVTLKSGRYSGRPMAKHLPLPVDARHFDRWLALFEETARDLCPPAAAARFTAHAKTIAESLELGIATRNGRLLMRGERFWRGSDG
ncbi:group III truncated hemoglobin [Chelatococcus daeguensis]|uniref:Preprotein translocase subunit TatC n=1 Tax=Chelatococcus daeguensis TaxID=444444 RepID=A0AAC9P088_9HYPH|nr:group III truncated hemoglobin [Chelatococcus daeguensis]APF38825.1 preprotein translocase subunit TatC [Chelatococcus daeguensis]KZE30515.1 preprotein translocase subunit TatC [Chelatococcus daeguensis]MBM3081858.1 group III truncated hemoglobin [Chelatococcus daeguensis]